MQGANAEYGRSGLHMVPVFPVFPSHPQNVKFIGSLLQLVEAQRPAAAPQPAFGYSQKSDADAQSAVLTQDEPSEGRC